MFGRTWARLSGVAPASFLDSSTPWSDVMIKTGGNCRVLTSDGRNHEGMFQFTWSPLDPAAVVMSTYVHGQPHLGWVTWIFARDLLAEGLTSYAPAWAGVGDVRVTCWDILNLRVSFSSPEGEAIVVLPWKVADLFVRQSFRVCPADQEGAAYEVATRVAVREILRDAA